MFETAELGRTLPKDDYKALSGPLRQDLLALQDELRRHRHFPVLVLFAGVDGAGKSECVGLISEWMDQRFLSVLAYDEPFEGERERPEFWRYWRDLPARGRIGLFLSAWYSRPLLDRVHRRIDEAELARRLEHIVRFETTLVRDGALIVKFWMHLSRDGQEKRLRNLEADPLTRARVGARDWENWRLYDRFITVGGHLISRTNRGPAPWQIVEGADANYRGITVMTALRDALARRLDEVRGAGGNGDRETAKPNAARGRKGKKGRKRAGAKPDAGATAALHAVNAISVLDRLDLDRRLDKPAYRDRLAVLQGRLHGLHLQARQAGLSSVLVFEGPDAAGKGGAIRRIDAALDPRNYDVHGIAAPNEEERARHYLWRFWRRLPRAGRIALFDRSWYGRVLVERVEGFASDEEWRRAYGEINDFEEQLLEHGIVLMKYWIHISQDEQLARFRAREAVPYKRWKLTEEDWRNREKWPEYERAVNDMVQFTSTAGAPWTLVAGNDKRHARIHVLEAFCDRLEGALADRGGAPADQRVGTGSSPE